MSKNPIFQEIKIVFDTYDDGRFLTVFFPHFSGDKNFFFFTMKVTVNFFFFFTMKVTVKQIFVYNQSDCKKNIFFQWKSLKVTVKKNFWYEKKKIEFFPKMILESPQDAYLSFWRKFFDTGKQIEHFPKMILESP